ncbi:MAG: HEAT repeat domain-containing protein [bacterium]
MHTRRLCAVIVGCLIFGMASSVLFAAEDATTTPTPSPAAEEEVRWKESVLRKEMWMLARSRDEESFSKLAGYATDTDHLLLVLVHDESSPVRSAAARSMGRQRNEKADEVLIEVLDKDKSGTVREKAIQALGRCRTEKARDKVLDCLKSEQVDIRSSAAAALGRSKDKKVIEPLISALNDPDYKVRSAASKSLSRLSGRDDIHEKTGGKPADEMHQAWQDWWEKNKETFEFAGRGRRSASAEAWVKKYDVDKDGKLDEKELKTALEKGKKGKSGKGIKKGTPLKTGVAVKKTDGSKTTLAELLKGTTLIYYFRSKCRHCVKAEGFIKKLYEDSKGKGIAFLGIASNRESTESLNAYLDRVKFGFPVVRDNRREFARQNRPGGTPSVLIVDASGKVRESYRGLSGDKRQQLTKSLAELSEN